MNVGMAIALAAGQPLLLAMLLGLLIGAICGFTNGALSVVLRIPTIIVTLGTLSLFRGLALVLADGKPVSNYNKDNWFFQIGGGTILGVPTSVWGMIVVGILGFLSTTTPFSANACRRSAAISRLPAFPASPSRATGCW